MAVSKLNKKDLKEIKELCNCIKSMTENGYFDNRDMIIYDCNIILKILGE